MDNVVRSSKEALRAHLPFYDDNVLRLPSFFGASLRTIHLPTYCQDKTKKERQAILALIACVRLHHYGLLTDRLLPLSRNDIRDRIYAASVKNHLLSPIQRAEPLAIRKEFDGTATVFQYNVILEGSAIEQARKSLNVGERQIALVTLRPLGGLPVYNHKHPEFGLVSCRLGTVRTSKFTGDAVATLSDFFAVLMNARWKRRTKDSCFQSAASDGQSLTSNFYCVGCVRQSGEMDWEFMKMILRESRRDADERLSVVQSLSETEMLPVPRLWSPIYREHSVYVTYGPADLRCDSDFPADTKHTNIKTYQDYFMNVWKLPVPEDAPLFRCQRLWKLPSTYFPIAANDTGTQNMNTHENNSDGFPHLGFVLLPKCLCAETSLISNAWLSFELIVLPQFLYHFERHLTGKAFTDFCVERFPALGRSLTSAQPEDVVGLLSAKSCSDQCSYERLEWLGDAVLKLVQTDAIMKSKSLRDWVANLHEGDLDSIRSVMCSNAYLHSMCKSTGCDQFIRTERLERGIWTPTSLELYSQSAGTITSDSQPANKVCADVIEAILGFVYLDGGYSLARKVADELQITLSWSNDSQENGRYEQDYSYLDNCLAAKAKSFTGYGSFRNPWLLEEAFTHPTALNTRTSSYQRLEWIGDAVLSVAVRHWIFDSYPKAEVGEMVLMEAPLVTNETLAFLSLRSDLHSHLQHRDRTLPGRILFYHSAVRELGKGLWSTSEFPKPMADIVESLLGAIYVDAGFEAGQKATLRVLSPILALYKESGSPSISHLKRSLLEFGGDLFTLTVLTESEFFQSHGSFDVWHGSRLGPVDRDGEDQVALVCCLGFNLLAVVDISASSAINRASALTLGVLDGSPALTQRFIAARSQTMSGIKRKATV